MYGRQSGARTSMQRLSAVQACVLACWCAGGLLLRRLWLRQVLMLLLELLRCLGARRQRLEQQSQPTCETRGCSRWRNQLACACVGGRRVCGKQSACLTFLWCNLPQRSYATCQAQQSRTLSSLHIQRCDKYLCDQRGARNTTGKLSIVERPGTAPISARRRVGRRKSRGHGIGLG